MTTTTKHTANFSFDKDGYLWVQVKQTDYNPVYITAWNGKLSFKQIDDYTIRLVVKP